MALGGGTWEFQNKILPGAYINFVSAASGASQLGTRGVAAAPLLINWGAAGTVFGVTAQQFRQESYKLFGYAASSPALTAIRDLFRHAGKVWFYRAVTESTAAANTFATALYKGTRGNAITIKIQANAADSSKYDVSTLLDGAVTDTQTVAQNTGGATQLADNDYVTFIPTATLAATAGTPLTGGTDADWSTSNYQAFFDAIQSYAFNILISPVTDSAIQALFADFTKHMRDDRGVKFQTVMFRYTDANYEGVISVENSGSLSGDSPDLVWWVGGAEASCAVNKSLSNTIYDGDTPVDLSYTQDQLEDALSTGKLILHRVGDTTRVLADTNTLTAFTEDKSADFAQNQVIRVIDQIANDIAKIFYDKYIGKIPNDPAGRVSLWNDIVKHHEELQRIRAIEDFEPLNITVEQGDTKTAVLVTDMISPISAMTHLYMTVVVA
jgi:hypothetical protein